MRRRPERSASAPPSAGRESGQRRRTDRLATRRDLPVPAYPCDRQGVHRFVVFPAKDGAAPSVTHERQNQPASLSLLIISVVGDAEKRFSRAGRCPPKGSP